MRESILPLWWCRLTHYLHWRRQPWDRAGPYEIRVIGCPLCNVTWEQRRLRSVVSS
jgi:hypothetical protein